MDATLNNPLLLSYSLRHLLAKKTQSLLTIGGIVLVVFVFVSTLMLREGLRQTLASTGSPDNVIVYRIGAQNEVQSVVPRADAAVVLSQPEVAPLSNGAPFGTADVVALVSLKKRSDGEPSNVNIRGVSPGAFTLRPGVTLVQGRNFTPGTQEIIVGDSILRKFRGTEIGSEIRLAGTNWHVVGIFSAARSAFASEIWGDAAILMPAFKRDRFSSVTFRMRPGTDFAALKGRLEQDKRLQANVERESEFYESQSKKLGLFIQIVGSIVSTVFSLGAIIGAMITMYSSVASRRREIGILRALGFPKRTIFGAFLKECCLLGLAGGIVGIAFAALMSFVQISTTNFSTFAEVGFGFSLTPAIVLEGLFFAALMGVIGGTLPAIRAYRMEIISSLRQY